MNIQAKAGVVSVRSGAVQGTINRTSLNLLNASSRTGGDLKRVASILWDCAPDRPVYPSESAHRVVRNIRG